MNAVQYSFILKVLPPEKQLFLFTLQKLNQLTLFQISRFDLSEEFFSAFAYFFPHISLITIPRFEICFRNSPVTQCEREKIKNYNKMRFISDIFFQYNVIAERHSAAS